LVSPDARKAFVRAQTKERCVMKAKFSLAVAAVMLAALSAGAAGAQVSIELPPIDVNYSRWGGAITGASTSVITAEDIARLPAQSLPNILSQQTGVQTQHLLSSTNGSRDTVDLRGFGAFAPSNVLILVNGRRYQDFDLQGFDYSSIPLNSIERIEITRGNSGAVLYGDGAIGGVVNIVTKGRTTAPNSARVQDIVGSFKHYEGRASVTGSSGPWSVALFGNAINSGGYRVNSNLRQRNINGSINYAGTGWGAYATIDADRQYQGLPAGLNNLPGNYPYTLDTPWQSNTPLDWAKKQGIDITGGFTVTLAPGAELIVDGGVRRKFQQAQYYSYLDPVTFLYNLSAAAPVNYVDTVMTTSSVTPRLDLQHQLFGVPNRLLTGIDFYNTQYNSDRPTAPGLVPVHRYDIAQTTAAFYAMNTTSVTPDTDVSLGGRLQRNMIDAHDTYSPVNDPNAGFYANNPEAPLLRKGEWQYAAHIGVEHRVNSTFAVFGRAARAFRLGNADERVGAGGPFVFTVPSFDLKTQTSYDIEGGVRVNSGLFHLESSIYLMRLKNEIHFLPALGVDANLDPTERWGWETSASYRLSDTVRLRGGVAYVRATFREGPYAGNDIPLVSRWSGNAGLSWQIVQKLLALDVTALFFGPRRMDNDQLNIQPLIPGQATVDVKLGGEYERFFWSASVLNVFDKHYFDYAIASGGIAGGPFFPAGLPPTIGLYNAFPLAGRSFMVQAGATF
jgi:iron complex outermembrane receptor protein